jgi:ADP-heptose:LPS heptosyltransferase
VVLLGGEDDKPICGFIKENEGRCINLCAECDLMTFAAIIKRAKFLVTNDGGPLHVAVACATKTVSIFGPVDDRIYGPYPKTESHIVVKKEDMDCSPCYKGFKIKECSHRSCLEDISAEEAISAVKRILCR